MGNEAKASLIDAARAVVDAWRDYQDDDGQIMPGRLCDKPELMGDLEAAIEAEKQDRPTSINADLLAAAEIGLRYAEECQPPKTHGGPCGPESGCDAGCMALA